MLMKVCWLRHFISVKRVPERHSAVFFEVPIFKSYNYYVTLHLSHYNSGHENQKLQKVNGQRERCAIVDNMLTWLSCASSMFLSILNSMPRFRTSQTSAPIMLNYVVVLQTPKKTSNSCSPQKVSKLHRRKWGQQNEANVYNWKERTI